MNLFLLEFVVWVNQWKKGCHFLLMAIKFDKKNNTAIKVWNFTGAAKAGTSWSRTGSRCGSARNRSELWRTWNEQWNTYIEHSDSNRWFLQERPSQCTESLGLAEVNNNMWYPRHINKASQTMKLIFNRTYWKPHCDAIGKKQPQCNNSVSRLHVHIKNLSLSLTLRIISAVLDSNTRGSTLTLPRGSIPTLLFRFSYFPTVNF